jgi:hypothetical protein
MHTNSTDDKRNSNKWLIITILFAIGITCYILPHMVLHPWRMVPNLLGDGGKNTFTYLYHVLFGKGVWFTGMNYPYGEHIVFTDGQPLLSVVLSSLGGITIAQAFAVMGWLTALSYVLAVIFNYKILSFFNIPPFAAMIFGGLIAVFTPQMAGIPGHYALSYSCIIPMLFYWTIKYNQTEKWSYPLYIFIMGTLFGFLHPYYAALVFIWVAAYVFGNFIFSRRTLKQRLQHSLPILSAPLIIFIIIGLFMKLTDPFTDRPVAPFSSGDNYTTLRKILTSPFSPVWQYLRDHGIIKKISEGGEGCSYPGIAIMIILIIAFILAIFNKLKHKPASPNSTFSPIWLFMAFGILLFSMGVPFIWHMEWLLDYVSFFKQFRTLGRFSWIFYYIITIYGVVLLNSWYTVLIGKGKKIAAYSMLAIFAGFWAYEATGITGLIRNLLDNGIDNYAILAEKQDIFWNIFLADNNRKREDFQAVLLLKFFEVGSEKLWLDGDVYGITIGTTACIQLHLPMVDAMMSRTSWSIAEKQVKIIGGPYVHKPILDDIKNDKPFLLINMGVDSADLDQKYLLEASDYIGNYCNSRIYACYPARIRSNDKQYAAAIDSLLPYLKTGDTCIKNAGTWFVDHFDTHAEPGQLFGTGAIAQKNQAQDIIASIRINATDANHIYEFSCWPLVVDNDYKTPNFLLQILDSANNIIDTKLVMTKNSTDNLGLWFRANLFFIMPVSARKVNCVLERNSGNYYKLLDEFMLRPADALVISKDAQGKTMVNNHLYKPEKDQ